MPAMRRTALAALAGLAGLAPGCNFSGAAPGSGSGDGGLDADAAPVCSDWGQRRFFRGGEGEDCDLPEPVAAPVLAGNRIVFDTTDGSLTPVDGTVNGSADPIFVGQVIEIHGSAGEPVDALVLSVDSFEVPADLTLRIVGELPLVIAGWAGVDIAGTLDAGSTFDEEGVAEPGPGGAIGAGCDDLPGTDEDEGGGGGGGGGFGGFGASGGAGDGGAAGPGDPGSPIPSDQIPLRGGCGGGQGGDGDQGAGGLGGPGGGAVVLASLREVEVTGSVLAGGAGGRSQAAQRRNGGGGGGSGGLISLEGETVTIDGIVAANGGGGGGGANGSVDPERSGQDGQPGDEPALGGDGEGSSNQGDGGAGASRGSAEVAVNGIVNDRGGGGGGGGVGIIFIPDAAEAAGTLSPAPLSGLRSAPRNQR
jgi:hypothetical protein